jgi:hypothetical protein
MRSAPQAAATRLSPSFTAVIHHRQALIDAKKRAPWVSPYL